MHDKQKKFSMPKVTASNTAEAAKQVSKAVPDSKVKTSGVKIRGTGAATKGLMARGPMA